MIARRPGPSLGIALSFAAAGILTAPALAEPVRRDPEKDHPYSRKNKRNAARIIMDGAVGDVTHVFSDEPMSKRRMRRLRGRGELRRSITDCGEEGCEECDVCRYLDFLEWAGCVGKPDGSVIQRDDEIEAYLRRKYPPASHPLQITGEQ
jgi:hypothetical protein